MNDLVTNICSLLLTLHCGIHVVYFSIYGVISFYKRAMLDPFDCIHVKHSDVKF